MESLRKLKDREHPRGTGLPDFYVDLVERTETKAIYERSDSYYEVFKIKIAEAEEVFGEKYPRREVYPGNEDFGLSAWCFQYKDRAKLRYDKL
jgi:hypothetical protein